MTRGWKGHSPTVKPSTKATSGFFMGSAIPPQLGIVNKKKEHLRNGRVDKVDRLRIP